MTHATPDANEQESLFWLALDCSQYADALALATELENLWALRADLARQQIAAKAKP